MGVYTFEHASIDGAPRSLAEFTGQALLIVNVASECGLTPHYAGMQGLFERYAARGFSVLGFPCDQFGGQEPGDEEQIKRFCEARFGVTFPMFAKLEVNGEGRHPLYAWLTSQATEPDPKGDIEWNFAKFLVGPDGEVVARFAPSVTPDDPALVAAIERLLPS